MTGVPCSSGALHTSSSVPAVRAFWWKLSLRFWFILLIWLRVIVWVSYTPYITSTLCWRYRKVDGHWYYLGFCSYTLSLIHGYLFSYSLLQYIDCSQCLCTIIFFYAYTVFLWPGTSLFLFFEEMISAPTNKSKKNDTTLKSHVSDATVSDLIIPPII